MISPVTTSRYDMEDKCYYDSPGCCEQLWECQTCNESFCDKHYHVTSKGKNVECVACEHRRHYKPSDLRLRKLERHNAYLLAALKRTLQALKSASDRALPDDGSDEMAIRRAEHEIEKFEAG